MDSYFDLMLSDIEEMSKGILSSTEAIILAGKLVQKGWVLPFDSLMERYNKQEGR